MLFPRPARLAALLCTLALAAPALAIDEAHAAKAKATAAKGVAFLKARQDAQGSFAATFPLPDGTAKANDGCVGITALALAAMADQGVARADPAVQKALAYLLSQAKPTGEISSGNSLQNYNTSIALSAMARFQDDPKVAAAIKNGQEFLIGKQWQEGMVDPKGEPVKEGHPFYGGAGYGGKHGRPDMSNTQFMLQALRDTGVKGDDPAMKRALAFLEANQGISGNKLRGAQIEPDGGFVYATSINKDHIGTAQSFASEGKSAAVGKGEPPEKDASRLRTYGSMTYAGFKSYLYADLAKDDSRVQAALGWIKRNYTLESNPGIPHDEAKKTHLQGLFYYYITFGRALAAWGSPTLEVNAGKDPATGKALTQTIDWQNDLTDKLAELQKEDGSWTNEADRWMEGDPRLVTAYAVIALNNALGLEK